MCGALQDRGNIGLLMVGRENLKLDRPSVAGRINVTKNGLYI